MAVAVAVAVAVVVEASVGGTVVATAVGSDVGPVDTVGRGGVGPAVGRLVGRPVGRPVGSDSLRAEVWTTRSPLLLPPVLAVALVPLFARRSGLLA